MSEIYTLDPRKIVTGANGKLFVGVGDDLPVFLAEANEWSAKLSVSNTDIQPVGSLISYAVSTGITISITLTEIVVRDDVMLEPLITAIRHGIIPWYKLNAKLDRPFDDQEEYITFESCVPDGDIDLINLSPGEIVKRAWSFRGNALPQYQKLFAYEGKVNSDYTHFQG